MNRENPIYSEPDDWRAQLVAIIKQTKEALNDAATVEHFVDLIFTSMPTSSPITNEESIMLSVVVSDALNGVNIAEKYPAFFLRMLENKALLDDFLDTFDLLKQTQTRSFPPLPAEPSRDLSFLRKRPQPKVKVRTNPQEGWRVVLQQTIQQLETIFFAPSLPMQPTMRRSRALPLDDDNWFTLFRQDVNIANEEWTVLLEGKAIDDIEMSLSLDISVLPAADDVVLPALMATVHWGEYQDSVVVGPHGRATFPPVPLDTIIDSENDSVRADLQVTVEAFTEKQPSK